MFISVSCRFLTQQQLCHILPRFPAACLKALTFSHIKVNIFSMGLSLVIYSTLLSVSQADLLLTSSQTWFWKLLTLITSFSKIILINYL